MSGVGTMCVCGGAVSPSIRPNRIRVARRKGTAPRLYDLVIMILGGSQ